MCRPDGGGLKIEPLPSSLERRKSSDSPGLNSLTGRFLKSALSLSDAGRRRRRTMAASGAMGEIDRRAAPQDNGSIAGGHCLAETEHKQKREEGKLLKINQFEASSSGFTWKANELMGTTSCCVRGLVCVCGNASCADDNGQLS